MAIRWDAGNLLNGLAEFELRTKAAVGLYADASAKKMEVYAKDNARWIDRSGLARDTLSGTYSWVGDIARIELSHGMKYGIYLEFCNEKRYAIIKPTIDTLSPSIIRGLQNLLK